MAEDDPTRGEPRPRPARPASQGSGAETGYAVIGTMISGMAVWGGAGWLLDRWLDTRVFLPVGILLGISVAIYLVVKRYGGLPPAPGAPDNGKTPGGRRSRPRTQKGQR
ncbi:F0F1-type ATP synthase assembly protein I [Geodermatophilus normandii]|uniref:F0F1-type ATP synthase assembly protein I n=1 Tax=Geodermatophilus normandii TaxID=1137989 RepID=A0A317QK54_9ACTN|nr:AtpZ/AtpI family protein [Geodermatophilus normandii]PWW23106.1 F0F1-type ATP synthase assembly protein I [Geodermatophilus normandii]